METWIERTGLLRLDARKLDHRRPLRHLGRDEGLTFSRGQRHRRDTEVRKPRLQCRLRQSSNHFLVERVDDLGGQMLWCAKSLPSADLESRNELAQGWHSRCLHSMSALPPKADIGTASAGITELFFWTALVPCRLHPIAWPHYQATCCPPALSH